MQRRDKVVQTLLIFWRWYKMHKAQGLPGVNPETKGLPCEYNFIISTTSTVTTCSVPVHLKADRQEQNGLIVRICKCLHLIPIWEQTKSKLVKTSAHQQQG